MEAPVHTNHKMISFFRKFMKVHGSRKVPNHGPQWAIPVCVHLKFWKRNVILKNCSRHMKGFFIHRIAIGIMTWPRYVCQVRVWCLTSSPRDLQNIIDLWWKLRTPAFATAGIYPQRVESSINQGNALNPVQFSPFWISFNFFLFNRQHKQI